MNPPSNLFCLQIYHVESHLRQYSVYRDSKPIVESLDIFNQSCTTFDHSFRVPNLVLREVALKVGIAERGVQRIVQELADAASV